MVASQPETGSQRIGIAELSELAAPSSFLSTAWSRDNLVTSHPARLYHGKVQQLVSQRSLGFVLEELQKSIGPIQATAVHRGTFTWDIHCEAAGEPLWLQVPLALDEPGARGRARSLLPLRNVEGMQHFIAKGLSRFVLEPKDLVTLAGTLPAALYAGLPEHHRLHFARGSLQVTLHEGKESWVIALGSATTAELLSEMIAVLAYHYDADTDGGTAITDVSINDGDFLVRRQRDGTFALRLAAVRWREPRIDPSLFLSYLLQLVAYETWLVNGEELGIPVVASNPSIVFHGVVRGRRLRYRDLRLPEEQGEEEAQSWLDRLQRSRQGRCYRPWVHRFLAGSLPLEFGSDLRERWWQLVPLRQKCQLLELHARHEPSGSHADSAHALRTFIDRLSLEIGQQTTAGPGVPINEIDRAEWSSWLEPILPEPESRSNLTEALLAHWPYRSWDQLLRMVPDARGLELEKKHVWFGQVIAKAIEGTIESLPAVRERTTKARPIANPELYSVLSLPAVLHHQAARTFPSFATYMDSALHDEHWGYYGHRVWIGKRGHFNTHPESLSPHYGRWIAHCAFQLWNDMLVHDELGTTDSFPIIEFGAGNGRLARDILDAISHNARDRELPERDRWQSFSAQVEYRIYERSESLRTKQAALLGSDALITAGDARHPERTLQRDFPDGLVGFVVTNEVPDAFGVHKVVFTDRGQAFVALVVPRVEASVSKTLDEDLARRIEASDLAVRHTFALRENPGDHYLDGPTYTELMTARSALPHEEHEASLDGIWFEETYVPVTSFPELAEHLRANSEQYALALAAEDSGVVMYINVHANGFLRGLASSLRAGFILTVDYGDTTWGLVHGARRGDFRFRVFGDTQQDYVPRPNDPYAAPGTQDMTADVNFTDLAHTAQEAGLEVVHFGHEMNLAGEELATILDAPNRDNFEEFLGNPVFKLLLVGTRASSVFTGPLLTSLALTRDKHDVPKERRKHISSLRRALSRTKAPSVETT